MEKISLVNDGLSKSAKIVLSKSIFTVKNQRNFLNIIFSFKNVNLGDLLFEKNIIFEPVYFLKLFPLFDKLTFINGFFF